MEKVIVPTGFNRTGKRVLTVPLDEKKICAPAYRQYRKAYKAASEEWKHKTNCARQEYVERRAHLIATHVANDSTTAAEKYKITRVSLTGSHQLGDIPGLSSSLEEARKACVDAEREADVEREAAIDKASKDCDIMKRALRREIWAARLSLTS